MYGKRAVARPFSLIMALVLAAGAPAPAQEGASPPPPKGSAETGDLERTIYVPYKDLERVFEKDGRGVFLPYEEFVKLWDQAHTSGHAPVRPHGPPVDWAIAAGSYEGTIDGDVATLRVAYDVEVLKEGFASIPLPFGGTAIREISAKDARAVVAPEAGGGYRLIAPGPRAYRIELVLVARVTSRPGVRSLAIHVPPAAVSRLSLRVPEKGIKIDVTPNLAATTRDGEGDTTELLAFLGSASEVKVEWNPRRSEAEEGAALAFVETRTKVRIEEGVVRAHVDAYYQVLKAAIGEVALRLPAGFTLTKLEGGLVRDWTVEAGVARVRLHEKVRERVHVILDLERALPDAGGTLYAPGVEALGVERETGTIALVAAEGLRAKVVAQEGLSRIEAAEGAGGADMPFAAFRYLRHPWKLSLDVSRLEPEVELRESALLSIGDDTAAYRDILEFDVRRAGVFGWRISVPKGWQVLEVGRIGNPRAAVVKDFRTVDEPSGQQRLEVDLPGRTIGASRLEVLLSRRRGSRTEPVELVRLAVDGVQKDSGIVAIAVAPALDAVTTKSEGLRPVPIAEAGREGLTPARAPGWGDPDAEPRLAFRFARPPYAASFELSPRRPVVSADVRTLVHIADDVLKVDSTVVYQVLYAGIRELRVALPKDLEDDVEIAGAGIKEKRREELPGPITGTAAGAEVSWRILLQAEVTGSYALEVTYKRKLGELSAGKSVEAGPGELRVLDVFNETGHVAVQKGDELVIEELEARGLEPVDARELPAALASRGGIFRSYRYLSHPYALRLRVMKHEFAPVLDTMIDTERLDVVVTREQVARCEAVLELQNNRRQFLEVHLPEGSDLLAVYLDGQLVRPAIGATKEVALVSLPKGRTGQKRASLVLRYDVPLGARAVMGASGALRVPAPSFPLEGGGTIPTGRSRLELLLPAGYHFISFDSAMQRRFPDRRLGRTILAWLAPVPEFLLAPAGQEDLAPAPATSSDALNVALVRPPDAQSFAFTALEAASEVRLRFMSAGLAYGLAALFLIAGAFAAIRLGRRIEGPGPLLLLAAGLFTLGAFSGEALGGFLDSALVGALAVALGRALRYAFVEAPRKRRENAERARGPEIDALRKEVGLLREKLAPPPAPPPPAPPAAPPSAPPATGGKP